MDIIQQLAQDFTEKIYERFFSDNVFNLGELARLVSDDCSALAVRVIGEMISIVNLAVRDDKQGRKDLGLSLKEKDRERIYLTDVGEIRFRRDYYTDSEGHYFYPIDHILGIEKYEKLSKNLSAGLVSEAADVSYAKSAEIVTGSKVSRQTVHNAVKRVSVTEELSVPEEPREAEELHIYADEDHVHMQRPGKKKGKSSRIVPLITVTEGTQKVGTNRNATVNPIRFVSRSFSTAEVWDKANAYLMTHYDGDKLKRVYIHGDGGKWIRRGLNIHAGAELVMDKYHFEKHLKTFSNRFPEVKVRKRIKDAIEKGDESKFREIMQELYDLSDSSELTEYIDEFTEYVKNNFGSIQSRYAKELPGSCTEGQISHVIAKRFSRTPMGWSKECLGRLAEARVHKINGGTITAKNIDAKHSNIVDYSAYVEKLISDSIAGAVDWSIFDREDPLIDTSAPVVNWIKLLGRCQSLAV